MFKFKICYILYNTQLLLIEDTLISFTSSLIYPFIKCILPSILRISSLHCEKKDNEIVYKISKILQLL